MATDSSASSFDDEPTPHAQQQQSYAQQQQQQPRQLHHPQQQQQQSPYLTPNHNTSRPALSSPQPQYQAESFYSGGVQPGGVYYDSQRSHSQLALNVYGSGPRINEQPPTPRVPGTIPAARPAPHGPRAPVSHSRTPSPDLVIQQQLQQQQQQQPPPQLQPQQLQPQQQRELRSPATLAAGAVGLNMGNTTPTADGNVRKLRHFDIHRGVPSPPPPGFPPHQQQQQQQQQQQHASHRNTLPPPPPSTGQHQQQAHEYSRANEDEGEYSSDAAPVPSAKALGKRRAVEKVVDRKSSVRQVLDNMHDLSDQLS